VARDRGANNQSNVVVPHAGVESQTHANKGSAVELPELSNKAVAQPAPKKKWVLSQRSINNLVGVHPDLVKVVNRALELSPYDFAVTSGVRTAEQQAELVKAGKSKTHKSKHLTGRAVDIAAYDDSGSITWEHCYYGEIADVFKQAGEELGTAIEWGGDWFKFIDSPHFQLADEHIVVA